MILLGGVLVGSVLVAPATGEAQDEAYEEEARAVFNAGRAAFDDGRFDDALEYFRRAYELSGRGELLYNIGITADRLRRDQEALAALEQYLRDVPNGAQRRDAEARVEVLRQHAQGDQTATPDPDPTSTTVASDPVTSTPTAGSPPDTDTSGGGGGSVLSIVGPIALGALGLASIAVVIAGLASTDSCLDSVGGVCVEERSLSGGATALYAGVGGALIVGAVVWLIVGMMGGDDEAEDRAVAVTPNGVRFEL
jgi:tetratricopeptide (TPR) repeat protein